MGRGGVVEHTFILLKKSLDDGPQRSPECTAKKAIVSQKYCKCCMQEKLIFRLPWQLIKFNSLD